MASGSRTASRRRPRRSHGRRARKRRSSTAGAGSSRRARSPRRSPSTNARSALGKRGGRWETLRLESTAREFPELAATVISKVTTADLAAWRDARLKQVEPSTVQRDINLLRNVWSIARDEWHWCGDPSPWRGLRMPGDNPPRTRRIAPQEVRRLVRHLGYRTGLPPGSKSEEVAYAFLIALRTAMRAGEVLSLSDATVDLERRVATIHQHKTLKTTGRPRLVPFTRAAARLMRPLVGRWWTVDSASLDALFRKAKARLMIEGMTFHDSRAEALTRLSRKVDLLTLARISGHKDIGLLGRVYYRESAADIAARIG